MKNETNFRNKKMVTIPYPNAATRRELAHRFLDLLLTAACGMGLAAALSLLLVVF